MKVLCRALWFKTLPLNETVSLILSDPPFKDDNDRFTTVPLKS